ncbi:MAG: glycosyltransferase family 4 protein [Patescibacteria group bacterium]
MKILISTGIYPPDIGGPAQYARNLYETWKAQGHDVKVAAYRWERAFPTGIRHLLFFTKIIRKGWNADLILVLDTWSAAVPTMLACKLMRKKYIIRTGGDFLWETYVERTGDLVLFRNFYETSLSKLSRKEKIIYFLGGKSLRKAHAIIYSTEWQQKIFEKAYGLDPKRSRIVENFCGPKEAAISPEGRVFMAATRELKWKNIPLLKQAFKKAQEELPLHKLAEIEFDTTKAVYDNFQERMRRSYAVILTSLGDISPNMIFDAIRVGVPFIVTKETGITERVRECAVLVDPTNERDIKDKIIWMADPTNRALQAEKVAQFDFVHTWEDIGREIITIHERL